MNYREFNEEQYKAMQASIKTTPQNINFHTWLVQDFKFEAAGVTIDVPLWYRLCYLVMANGGWEMKGYGNLSYMANGHQKGLTQDEAFELLYYFGYVNGTRDNIIGDPYEELKAYYNFYLGTWGMKHVGEDNANEPA